MAIKYSVVYVYEIINKYLFIGNNKDQKIILELKNNKVIAISM